MNKKFLVGSLAAVASLAALVPSVQAEPPADTGWDGIPDVVVGGGSDTTYVVSERLTFLYNQTPGCSIILSSSSPQKGLCSDQAPGSPTTGPTNGNYDHDLLVGAAATGSSAGVVSLLPPGTNTYNPGIDYARSSRGPAGTETNDLTFWGYARDGLTIQTFGTRGNINFNRQQLIDIFVNCTLTNWSQIPGQAAGPIIPWDMNPSSGTTASFKTYLGSGGAQAVFGPCTRKLVGSTPQVAPFENDNKPIFADPGLDLVPGTADDDENNYIWWMSSANWNTYPFTKNGCVNGVGTYNAATLTCNGGTTINSNLNQLDGTLPTAGNLFASTYGLMRTVYHVTRNVDADCTVPAGAAGACAVGPNVTGADTGKRGAVREFTEWLCRTTNAQHTVSITTGEGYRSLIVKALNQEGFQQLSATVAGLRTPGYACSVST
jgi:ABC-type phosphate transport system substrate-binding protein